LFTTIVGPSVESKVFGEKKKELAERHLLRLRFWEQLLERAKSKGVMTHSGRSPGKEGWISAGAGRSGLSFNYVIWMDDRAAAELYIDTGKEDENKAIFDQLVANKQAIESAFGGPLTWERLEDRRASRIRCPLANGGLSDPEERWVEIQDAMIDVMDRLTRALGTYLKKLRVS
jgi:hypothetical protein